MYRLFRNVTTLTITAGYSQYQEYIIELIYIYIANEIRDTI